jgi:membrane peptidoglycan carboxypeptidase
MATGSEEVTPLEMASGYQTIANGGVHCRPFTIKSITRASSDEVLYEHEPQCFSVLKSAYANEIVNMLVGVVESGTAADAFASWVGPPVAGKTGTSDLNKNVWFVGFTQQVSTSVWVGSPGNPYELQNYWGYDVFGGSTAAPIWVRYMESVVSDLPTEEFPDPVRTTVPDVIGMTSTEARATLTAAGLSATVQIVDSAQPEGTVVAQDPGGGSETFPDSVVSLEVSNGVAPIATVPDVLGMNSGVARALLIDEGFKVDLVEQVGPNENNHGRVIAQNPRGGSDLLEGKTVTITAAVAPIGGGGGGNAGNGNSNGNGNG